MQGITCSFLSIDPGFLSSFINKSSIVLWRLPSPHHLEQLLLQLFQKKKLSTNTTESCNVTEAGRALNQNDLIKSLLHKLIRFAALPNVKPSPKTSLTLDSVDWADGRAGLCTNLFHRHHHVTS